MTKKISNAFYLSEKRRILHKKMIWFVPFIGPLIIKGFWKAKKNQELEIMTKSKRKLNKGDFSDNWQNIAGHGGV